jgi:hypothetical protein
MKNSSPQHSHASAGNPSARDSVPVEKNKRARPLLDEKQNRRSAPAHRCIDHLLPEVCLWKRQNSALICFPIHKQRRSRRQMPAAPCLFRALTPFPFLVCPGQKCLGQCFRIDLVLSLSLFLSARPGAPAGGREDILSPAGFPGVLWRCVRLPARERPGRFPCRGARQLRRRAPRGRHCLFSAQARVSASAKPKAFFPG